MTVILGIDPGTIRMGYGILDGDELKDSGTFVVKGDIDERLRLLWAHLNSLKGEFDLVAVEMPPGYVKGRRPDTGLKIGMGIGVKPTNTQAMLDAAARTIERNY